MMEIQVTQKLSKKLFYITLVAGCYFTLVFTGLMRSVDFVVLGAIFELFTIPLIVITLAIFIYLIVEVFIRQRTKNIYAYCSLVISAAVLITSIAFTIYS
jgi:hypothetical protein